MTELERQILDKFKEMGIPFEDRSPQVRVKRVFKGALKAAECAFALWLSIGLIGVAGFRGSSKVWRWFRERIEKQ